MTDKAATLCSCKELGCKGGAGHKVLRHHPFTEPRLATEKLLFSANLFTFKDKNPLRVLYQTNQETRRLRFEAIKAEVVATTTAAAAAAAAAATAAAVESKAAAATTQTPQPESKRDWLARTMGDTDLLSPPLGCAEPLTIPVFCWDGFTLDGSGDPLALEIKAAVESLSDSPDEEEYRPATAMLVHLQADPLTHTGVDALPIGSVADKVAPRELPARDVRLVFYSVADPLSATFTIKAEADLVRLILADVRTQLPVKTRVHWEKRRPLGPQVAGSMHGSTDPITDGVTTTSHSFSWDGQTAALGMCIPGVKQSTRDSAAAFATCGFSDILIWLWPADDPRARPSVRFARGGAPLGMNDRRGRDWHDGVSGYDEKQPLAIAAGDSLEYRMRKEFTCTRNVSVTYHEFAVIDVFYSASTVALERVHAAESDWFTRNSRKPACCVHRVEPADIKGNLNVYWSHVNTWQNASHLAVAFARAILDVKYKSRNRVASGELSTAVRVYKLAQDNSAPQRRRKHQPRDAASAARLKRRRELLALQQTDAQERPLKRARLEKAAVV